MVASLRTVKQVHRSARPHTVTYGMDRAAFAALAIFVFTIPWERTVAIPFFGAAGTPIGLIAAGLAAMSLFEGPRLKLRTPSLVLVLMAIFVAWSALTYFWSVDPSRTLVGTARYAQLLIVVWLVWQLGPSAGRTSALMQAYVFGAYVSLTLVAWNFIVGNAYLTSAQSVRYTFDQANPNYLALSLAIGIPMAWHLFSTPNRTVLQIVNALYVIFAVFVIVLTASRGGFATAVVAVLIVPWSFWRLGATRMLFVFVMYAGLAYAGFGLIPEQNVDRLSLIETGEVVEGLDTRTRIWTASLALLENEPSVMLRGAGIGAHPAAVAPYLGRSQEAHNGFVSLAVEGGLIGVGLFVAFLLLAVAPNVGLEPQRRIFFLVLAATLVTTLLPANWEDQKAFWFGLALLTSGRSFVLTGIHNGRRTPPMQCSDS